jgi:hypothetical protein
MQIYNRYILNYMSLFISDIHTLTTFARKKGSKDKRKRKTAKTIGAGAIVGLGINGAFLSGGIPKLARGIFTERKGTENANKAAEKVRQTFLSDLDKDSMKVYGDTLHQLKMGGIDQRTASTYAEQAKQEFADNQRKIFQEPVKVKANYFRHVKKAAPRIAVGAAIGVGIGLGAKALRKHQISKQENKSTKSPKQ